MKGRFNRALGLGLAFGLAAVATGVLPAAAQSGADEIQILDIGGPGTDGSGDAVTIEVAIPAGIGQAHPTAADFALTENGQARPLAVTALSTTVDVMVVLDTSGSMQGTALSAAKKAAREFISNLAPDARVGVIGFGSTAEVRAEPGTDRAAALDALSALQASGETALWDALALAGSRMQAAGAERPYVVVLADGANSAGSADQPQAVAALTAAGAAVYAIAIDSPDTDAAALRSTVDSVGGQFFTTADVGGLQALYTDIAGRLASRYELTYRSATPAGRSLVLSVAADGAVATAETTVAGTAPVTALLAPAAVLNTADQPTLGAVSVQPGLAGSPWLRPLGIAALVGALVIVALLAAAPAVRVRLDPANSADRARDTVAGVNGRLTGAADRFVARRDGSGQLDMALDSAGVNLRPGELVLAWLVAVVASAVVFTLVAGPIAGTAIAAAVAAGTVGYLRLRIARRRQQFADQLVDTLSIVSSGLRAGRGLPQALELVSEEAPSPTAEEFRRVMFEVRVGRDLTTALAGVSRRMNSDDLSWVTRAIDINRELGGDLTEVLGNVADTIRDRRRVARQVQSLSAEGRATGWVLMALPFLMFTFIAWRNPGSVDLLTGTGLGRLMLGGALVSMAVGFVWVRKLVSIRY